MSDARDRTKILMLALAAPGAHMASLLEGYIAGMLTVTDAYKLSARVANEELEIARRDIAILRKQRTEARKAAKVLAVGATGPIDLDHDDALRLALNYR